MGTEARKLHELNGLLRGADDTSFAWFEGAAGLAAVRYVITLDADTVLPRDGAVSWWALWPIPSIGHVSTQ